MLLGRILALGLETGQGFVPSQVRPGRYTNLPALTSHYLRAAGAGSVFFAAALLVPGMGLGTQLVLILS